MNIKFFYINGISDKNKEPYVITVAYTSLYENLNSIFENLKIGGTVYSLSIQSPKDNFCKRLGRNIAKERLEKYIENLSSQLEFISEEINKYGHFEEFKNIFTSLNLYIEPFTFVIDPKIIHDDSENYEISNREVIKNINVDIIYRILRQYDNTDCKFNYGFPEFVQNCEFFDKETNNLFKTLYNIYGNHISTYNVLKDIRYISYLLNK